MARQLRTEEEGGLYHVINRGNYRQWVFKSEGAKQGFEKALFEACALAGWVLHAYCVMGNHYHLALETPRGNLSEGMRWLQSVFANRFNRLRKENGRLFQGRFKSLVVEDSERLAWLCHYIHLNPVRAGICPVEQLKNLRWCSSWYWRRGKQRPACLSFTDCLEGAGGLRDTGAGWTRYERYLGWLVEDRAEQKRQEFAQMSAGWAVGSRSFQKALVSKQRRHRGRLRLEQKTVREARELAWEERLERCLRLLRKKPQAALDEAKAAAWKVAIAAHLKERLMCSNQWLAERLHMGVLYGVSRYVGGLRSGQRPEAQELLEILNTRIKE